jgi:arylsulfatase A-like enzyme
VQQADLMPTLLALAGVRVPEPVEGRDLSGLLLRRTPLAPSGVPLVSHLTYATADKAAARLGRFKLVFNRELQPIGPRLELFDVADDPGELHNIADREPVATQYLLAQLASLRQAEKALKERRRSGEEVALTAEEKEALRALGYVQ